MVKQINAHATHMRRIHTSFAMRATQWQSVRTCEHIYGGSQTNDSKIELNDRRCSIEVLGSMFIFGTASQ